MDNLLQSKFDLVTFDDFGKLRVLNPQQFDKSDKLKDECNEFVSKIDEFNGITRGFLEVMEEHAKKIEVEKLRAIGLRNQVENEENSRKEKKESLETLIKEREMELDRLVTEYESFEKTDLELQALIDQLSGK